MKKVKFLVLIILVIASFFIIANVSRVEASTFIWPIGGDNNTETYVEYLYGPRNYSSDSYNQRYKYAPYEEYYAAYENHYGIDIIGIKGHNYSVVSVADGKVIATSLDRVYNPGSSFVNRNKRQSSRDGGGYGNYIIIEDSATGKCFLYGHLQANSFKVTKGSKVKAGQEIAKMGSSGDSGHKHLHFEVRRNKGSVISGDGAYLVNTTDYNVETEDPLLYITKPVEKVQAKLSKITYISYNTSTTVKLYFDNKIKYTSAPTLTVTCGNCTITVSNAKLSSNKKVIEYSINHSAFDFKSYGTLHVKCEDGGKVVTDANGNLPVDCKFTSKRIGSIKELKIDGVYSTLITSPYKDVNQDGSLDIRDAAVLARALRNPSKKDATEEEKRVLSTCDFNGDKRVDIRDAAIIASFLSTALVRGEGQIAYKLDLNSDNKVDLSDYKLLEKAFNSNGKDTKYDLNSDGSIDVRDLSYFSKIITKYGIRK